VPRKDVRIALTPPLNLMNRHCQNGNDLITFKESITMNHPFDGLIAALICVLGLLCAGCADLPAQADETTISVTASTQGKRALPSRDFDSIDAP
jgi:hypothetical protein